MIQKGKLTEILEDAYRKAEEEISKDDGKSFLNILDEKQKRWLFKIAGKSESFKGVTAALTTCFTKKIEDPRQDIRYHRKEMNGGYSGRTLDTKYVTPFFKRKFRRLAMKESGWLSRSIEQPHPFTLDFPGRIRDKTVKEAFLQIINDIETNNTDSQKYLISLFILLIHRSVAPHKTLFQHAAGQLLDINLIIECLREHFFGKYDVAGASRLPVIAIYSIYQILLKDVKKYKDKKLKPLRSHVSPDARAGGIGDIEIINEKNVFFEGVEIKHNRPIDSIDVEDAYEKFRNTPVTRYYLLTTAEPNIKEGKEHKIKAVVQKIRREHGCEIIINGLIPSLKYYLRLLRDPVEFITTYTENLALDFSKSTGIKKKHIEGWEKIVEDKLYGGFKS